MPSDSICSVAENAQQEPQYPCDNENRERNGQYQMAFSVITATENPYLVLHGGGVDAGPVHYGGGGLQGLLAGEAGVGGLLLHADIGGQVAALELGLAEVRKSGHAVDGSATVFGLLLVAEISHLHVLHEETEALGLLLHGGIVATVFLLEGLPHVLLLSVVRHVQLGGSGGGNGKSDDDGVDHGNYFSKEMNLCDVLRASDGPVLFCNTL
jgi:hypothetical protein